jgi:hypothetical protein
MVWTTRRVFKKVDGDPLYEFFTSFPYGNKNAVKDQRIIDISFYRSIDRCVGLIYTTYQDKASWESWRAEHQPELKDALAEGKQWADDRNITVTTEQPETEDQDWSDEKYIVDGYRGYNRVTPEQILSGD